ncbi:MAG: ribosome maturation factor RimM [Hyphomicrobiales bacterium]
MTSGETRVVLGVITGAHGIRGEVKLKSFTADPRAIATYGPVTLGATGRSAKILSLRPQGDAFIARLEGLADRTAAEALKGCEITVPRAALPPAGEGEFYQSDVIGLPVELADGTAVGTVVAIANYGAGDLLEIEMPGRRQTALVPFVEAMVPVVDVAARRIVIDPPEGLLDEPGPEREQ